MDDSIQNLQGVIEKCGHEVFTELLHRLINMVLNVHPFASYLDYKHVWSLTDWWDVIQYCNDIIVFTSNNSFSEEKFIEQTKGLSSSYQKAMWDAVVVRREELRDHYLTKTNQISQSFATDFDWQVKMVMSSDKMSVIHEPLIHLDLSIVNHSKPKLVSLEMTKEDLKKTLTSLEAANKVMQQYRS